MNDADHGRPTAAAAGRQRQNEAVANRHICAIDDGSRYAAETGGNWQLIGCGPITVESV